MRKGMRSVGLVLAVAAASGCEAPDQDKFISQGGISPDPTARVEGSVLYIGPRPRCTFEPGKPPAILGRVVLTMFEYNNPPPPEGTATSALNLAYVNGDKLFYASDCLQPNEPANPEERITRSAPFVWPRLPLAQGRRTDYQIRGFYDSDEDMVPFFSVSRLPTEGDVIGAALNDIQDASKGFFKITLPTFEEAQNGAVIHGVTVALGNVVRTERPVFKLDANRKLSAETAFPTPVVSATGLDGAATLQNLRLATCATPDGATGATCGLTLLRFDEAEQAKANAVDVTFDADPKKYAFYAEPVDIKTVQEGLDVQVPDGKVDPHPFLAGLGVPWYSPMVLLQRAQSAKELEARIPRVIMVGSVLMQAPTPPETALRPTKSSYLSAPVALPPVGAVELITGRSDCRVPYFPRDSSSLVVNDRVAHCSEIPSGYYAVNVLGGVAGGTMADSSDPPSESGRVISGGRSSGQSWSVPNELGDSEQVGVESLLPSQSLVDGAFVVFDPNPAEQGTTCTQGAVVRTQLCEGAYSVVDGATGFTGSDSSACLPRDCCEAVAHLCGRPRCAIGPDAAGNVVSASPTTVTPDALGRPVPDCVPFEMPVQCCPSAT